MLHNSFGIFLAEQVFGPVIESNNGRNVPARIVAERHVIEDLGSIPTLADWLRHMDITPWMRHTPTERQHYHSRLGSIAVDRLPSQPCGT